MNKSKQCWKCDRKLNFDDFCKINRSLSKESLETYWLNPSIEFFCCSCYRLMLKKNDIKTGVEYREHKKVLFSRMEDSGKTATLRILKNQTIEEDLRPTQGIYRESVEYNNQLYHLWDLGGAERYCERYFKQHLAFLDVSELLFFINIQKIGNYDKSINFLYAIIQELVNENLDSEIKVFIFIHKSDSEIIKTSIHKENVKLLTEKVEGLNIPFSYCLSETSIYNFQQGSCLQQFRGNIYNNLGTLVSNILSN